jgi:pilus assembly protein TadC
MIVGAFAAGAAVLLAVLGARATSTIERRLHAVRPARDQRWVHTSAPRDRATKDDQLLLARIACALAAGLAGCAIAWVLGLGVLPMPIAAYAGAIAPSVVAARRDARVRRDAERAVITLVEWLHALTASGRPIETAVVSVAARGTGSAALDVLLDGIRRDYTLGVPLADAMARAGKGSGIRGLADLAARLERTRDLGRGTLPMLQDLRDELRAAERARALQVASHVEGQLTLVLTLCYLPALALLVIIPLFVTLLAGLFG